MTNEEYKAEIKQLRAQDTVLWNQYLEASSELTDRKEALTADRLQDAQFSVHEKVVIVDVENALETIDVAFIDNAFVDEEGHIMYHLYQTSSNGREMTLPGAYTASELRHFYIPF